MWATGWSTMRASRRPTSVRARVTLGAVAVVAVALVVLGVVIVALVRDGMVRTIEATATAQANSVATLAAAGQLPGLLEVDSVDRTVLQVVDANGRVLASSPQLAGLGPITGSLPISAPSGARTIQLALSGSEPALFRVVSFVTDTPSGRVARWVAAPSKTRTSRSLR